MSFWKKVYEKLLKKEDKNSKQIEEDEYLKKLKKKLKKYK